MRVMCDFISSKEVIYIQEIFRKGNLLPGEESF
jgi:hypothetical protein